MIAEKWEEYFRKKQGDVRQELIVYYIPLVKHIVRRMIIRIPSHLEQEDLISFGIMGLIEAVDKFNPQIGVKFETYASYRIRGMIIDEIRKANWLPRSTYRKIHMVTETYRQLEQSEVLVSEAQWAAAVGMTLGELHEVLTDISNLSCISLEEVIKCRDAGRLTIGDAVISEDSPDPQVILEESELKAMLKKALLRLEEKERLILGLYYNERLTLKEIGNVFNVSESRICQLHGRAIIKLKAYLEEWKNA